MNYYFKQIRFVFFIQLATDSQLLHQKVRDTKKLNYYSGLQSTSSSALNCSSLKPRKDKSEIHSSPTKKSYKWRRTNSGSSLVQSTFSVTKTNAESNIPPPTLCKSRSMSLLQKATYKWRKPSPSGNKDFLSSKKELGLKKSCSPCSSSMSKAVLPTKTVKSMTTCENQCASKIQRNKSRYKWSKNTKSLSTIESPLNISSSSLQKLLLAKVRARNSTLKYTKRLVVTK